jgi:hypothetical protein
LTVSRLFFLVLFWMAFGCKHEPFPNPGPFAPVEPANCDPDTVYFKNDILPMLVGRCAMPGCHAGPNPPKNVDLTSYTPIMLTADVRPGRPDHSDLYEVISETRPEKRMPPPPHPPLTSEQINQVRVWILQGALDNSCDDCDTMRLGYQMHIAPIIQNHCLGCHNSSSASGQVVLEHFSQVQLAVMGRHLWTVVDYPGGTGRMPPTGPLSDCDLTKIRLWIEAGMPEN